MEGAILKGPARELTPATEPAPAERVAPDESEDQLAFIDAELRRILPALMRCANGRVYALHPVHRISCVALLPFHLHAWWPDELKWLPLTARISVLPFLEDHDLTVSALYLPSIVRRRRGMARAARLLEARRRDGDKEQADWERAKTRATETALPPRSFVALERVRPDGSVACLSRPKLGRFASRGAPKPVAVVPGSRDLSDAAIAVLASSDLVIIDLQQLRGRRSLEIGQRVLAARPVMSPTLVLASSPSDFFAAGISEPPPPDQFVLLGTPSRLETVDLLPVGRDRLAADERLHTSLRAARGHSRAGDRVAALAENAWWAIRQAVHIQAGSRELATFEQALDDLHRSEPFVAGLFTGCRNLLRAAAADTEGRAERARVTVDAVLTSAGSGGIFAVTRTRGAASAIRAAVANDLGVTEHELDALGVAARAARGARLRSRPDATVLVGYAGMSALDAALSSDALTARAVFDPVEARVAWHHALKMYDFLTKAGSAAAAEPYRRVAAALAPHVTGFATSRELSLLDCGDPSAEALGRLPRERGRPGYASVYFTNGHVLDVPLGSRFEVLGRMGRSSRVTAVEDLKEGDRVVQIKTDAHTLFSQQRIAALDAGPLRRQSETRRTWLTLVRALANAKGLSTRDISNRLQSRGHHATAAAVSRWLSECPESAHAPSRLETFLELAAVIGLQLPPETLHQYFRDVQTWRVLHRLAGRKVAEAVRLAFSGRLGAASLAKIEREWGCGVRDLIDSAELGVVEDVLLPESYEQERPADAHSA